MRQAQKGQFGPFITANMSGQTHIGVAPKGSVKGLVLLQVAGQGRSCVRVYIIHVPRRNSAALQRPLQTQLDTGACRGLDDLSLTDLNRGHIAA